jgi:hypothetical protein
MIVKSIKEIETATNSSENDMKLEIDASQSAKLFSILLESYKNKRSSLIREYTSNAWDAQRAVGKTDVPVIVEIDEDDGGRFIQFIDEGTGMTYGFFKRTYRKLLKSTKDNSNDDIGGFGIGSKTALAYTNFYHVETVRNNRLNHFVVYKEANSDIRITRINYKYENGLQNGTKVKVYFKEGYEDEEERQFEELCVKELAYFDNVILRFRRDKNKAQAYNYYKIIEGDTFKYKSGNHYDGNIHLVLGKVAYTLDYKEIGIAKAWDYATPIALKFDIGELPVHMNRETIIYTDEAKAIIKQRLEDCILELTLKYNNQNKPITNIFKYLAVKPDAGKSSKFLHVTDMESIFLYGDAITKKLTNVKFAPALLLGLNDEIENDEIIPFINIIGKVVNGKFVKTHVRKLTELQGSLPLVLFENRNPTDSKEFLKYIQNCYIVKYHNIYAGSGYFRSRYAKLKESLIWDRYKVRKHVEDRYNDDTATYTEKEVLNSNQIGIATRIHAYKKIVMGQFKGKFVRTIDYDKFTIPIEWIEEQKRIAKENRRIIERAEGTISCRVITNGYSRIEELNLKTLNNFKGIIIYGFQENKEALLAASQFLLARKTLEKGGSQALRIYQIAKNNEKSMHNFKNAIHVNSFFKSSNRILVRMYTSYMIKETFGNLLPSYSYFEDVNSKVAKKLKVLLEYSNSLKLDGLYRNDLVYIFADLEALNNIIPMFDKNIEEEFNYCKRYFDGVPIIKSISINSLSVKDLVVLFKKYGKLVNYNHYNKPQVVKSFITELPIILVEREAPDLKNYTPKPIKIS